MNKAQLHYEKMTKTPVFKLIITLAIPTTLSMLITNIYNLADTYFVGTLGESAQGAIGIVFALQGFIQAFGFMLGHGSGTYVAKELADKNVKNASTYVSSAFFFAAVAGTVFAAIGLLLLTPFMRLLGSTETILPYAKDYGMWALISCPFLLCSIILNNNLRYEGKALFSMIGMVSGGLLNIFLDYVLINLCEMGVFGAGLATAVSQVFSFILLIIIYKNHAQSSVSVKCVSKRLTVYFSILKVGSPSLLRQGLLAISGGIMNNVVKPYGDSAIAAMTIVNKYSSFVSCIAIGIGQGLQPVASFNYQTKDYSRVVKGFFVTVGTGVALVGIISALSLMFPSSIIKLFQKSPDVVQIGATALRYAAIGLPFAAASIPVNMLFQSIRKPLPAAILSGIRSGVAFIPLILLFSSVWRLNGIMWAQPVADMVAAAVCVPFVFAFYVNVKK